MMAGILVVLRPPKVLAPLFRIVRCKGPEVLLQIPVGNLGLAIRLRVIRRAHLQLGAHEFEQFLPEVARKDRVAVGD